MKNLLLMIFTLHSLAEKTFYLSNRLCFSNESFFVQSIKNDKECLKITRNGSVLTIESLNAIPDGCEGEVKCDILEFKNLDGIGKIDLLGDFSKVVNIIFCCGEEFYIEASKIYDKIGKLLSILSECRCNNQGVCHNHFKVKDISNNTPGLNLDLSLSKLFYIFWFPKLSKFLVIKKLLTYSLEFIDKEKALDLYPHYFTSSVNRLRLIRLKLNDITNNISESFVKQVGEDLIIGNFDAESKNAELNNSVKLKETEPVAKVVERHAKPVDSKVGERHAYKPVDSKVRERHAYTELEKKEFFSLFFSFSWKIINAPFIFILIIFKTVKNFVASWL